MPNLLVLALLWLQRGRLALLKFGPNLNPKITGALLCTWFPGLSAAPAIAHQVLPLSS